VVGWKEEKERGQVFTLRRHEDGKGRGRKRMDPFVDSKKGKARGGERMGGQIEVDLLNARMVQRALHRGKRVKSLDQ